MFQRVLLKSFLLRDVQKIDLTSKDIFRWTKKFKSKHLNNMISEFLVFCSIFD